MPSKQNKNLIVGVVILALVIIGGVYYVNSSNDSISSTPGYTVPGVAGSDAMYDDLIADKIAEYNILKNQNAMPDQCMMAKTIGMLYLQKQDEAEYANWTNIGQTCEDAYIASQTTTP
ncbi:MAG: hypothetical protein MUF19_01070 [Candidatus Pacebacteria bacterium]|jgi:hypothetical protein|nr:hypothetical protein [Candidatus Paceibacterota bacterium]